MKILLLGEYSNVHWTLAEGLRSLGHEVCVISDGDGWKNYHRDIDLSRQSRGKLDTIKYFFRILRLLPRMKGYDIVQLINPIFLDLKADKIKPFYKYLRRHNKRIVLGAFGMDHYWVKTCMDCTTFRYSDFNIGNRQRTEEPFNHEFIRDWLDGEKTEINQYIANDCDAIVTALYEYDCCYRPYFPDKTTFIPLPIRLQIRGFNENEDENAKRLFHHSPLGEQEGGFVCFFVGIQKGRSEYKGTDIMLKALRRVEAEMPDKCKVVVAESVPFEEYRQMMNSSDVILDQLYSYTPAMNALQAMSQGLIVVGGGEEENYEILGEHELRPIINVLPNEDDCYQKMKALAEHPEQIHQLKYDSIQYVRRHHDYIKVAKEYLKVYESLL